MADVDAVVTHHRDGFRSGVARFNELLAQRLGVPFLGLDDLVAGRASRPLLSFKVSELGEDAALVEAALGGVWDVFLHEYADSELERRIITGARRVHCGNAEIHAAVRRLAASSTSVWTPGLLLDDRDLPADVLSVFSFGMAHKVRVDMFRRLRGLLDATAAPYAVYVSAANHESVSLRDSEAVFVEMHDVFPDELFFLGNLSDVAVSERLRTCTYFAAFFERGVRANNTSVASAMERGAVVITNLDEFSPEQLVHGTNVIDIEQCERLSTDREALRRLGEAARETALGRGWDELVEALR